jgi:hypothetical protein
VDRRTGEIVAARHDPDAAVQIEGGGNEVYGIKFVVVSARSDAGRVILEIRHVPHAKGEGGEAAVALRVFDEVAPLAPGIIGVIWDMALRGVHINTLMRKLGWLTVARVAAKERRHRRGQRGGFRVPKSAFVEAQDLKLRDGTIRKVPLYAVDGALGIGELNDRGERIFRPLRRVRTQRYPGGRGWRWYNQYALPDEFAKREINVRLHGDDSDAKRRFNRAENLRAIAPSDPDFDRLYALRPDAESLNRSIEDSLYLKKAHSVGRHRQEADFLGFALMTNSLTLARHRARERIAAA